MDETTASHQATAREFQAFATEIMQSHSVSGVAGSWAGVVGFYAAVHYVNAFLWHIAAVEPRNHAERQRLMARWQALSDVLPPDQRVLEAGIAARYQPGYRIPTGRLARLIENDLVRVETAIRSLLSDS